MNEITRLAERAALGGSIDDFLRRAPAVYDEQRKRIIDIEAEYERKRVEMRNSFGRKLADIAHEGAEALRKLESDHQRTLTEERAKLASIERLRSVHNGG
jgi:hypothetical protein